MKWINEFKSIQNIVHDNEYIYTRMLIFSAGMVDFQGYIDLALDTSDATDMTITLLTDLRTVGSSIFEFLQLFTSPNSCGFDELVEACKVFWKEAFDYRLLVIMCT